MVVCWTYVAAAPPGDSRDDDVGKKLYSFNILAVPQDNWSQDDVVCPNAGHRIFFQRTNSGSIGSILWSLDPAAPQNFKITDCDGTFDGTAAVLINEELEFWVMIRLLGKKTDTLGLVCADIVDVGVDDLCLLDGVKLNIPRGKDFTKIWFNVFDDAMESLLWELDTATGFRIAQVWVFEKL
jgi:hypothetical protein